MLVPKYENKLLESGFEVVVGVDEAGRGAWAGPVAVGYYAYQLGQVHFSGINDSKKLSPRRRAEKYDLLIPHGGVIYQPAVEIDRIGIGVAITDAIFQILTNFSSQYGRKKVYFLIDGQFATNLHGEYELVPKGDGLYYCIAAASILAKHGRDSLMLKLHTQYPDYGFDKHKGYGTALHKKKIAESGPLTGNHRYSFEPIKQSGA